MWIFSISTILLHDPWLVESMDTRPSLWRVNCKDTHEFLIVWGFMPLTLHCSSVNWTQLYVWRLYINILYIFYIYTYVLLLLFSHPVMSEFLRPHGLQHARPPCPSPSPGVCPSSCSWHQWCHPAVSSSDTLFSFCPQSCPASGTFPMSHLFASDDQNTGASYSVSALPVNIRVWSPLRLTGLISLTKGLLEVFSSTTVQRHQFFGILPSYSAALTSVCDHWEDQSLANTDLYRQSYVSAFQRTVYTYKTYILYV